MTFVQIHDEGSIRLILLSSGRANTLTTGVLGEILAAFTDAAEAPHVRGVVLGSANDGIFSAGFDAGEVFGYGMDDMRSFFALFINCYEAVCHFPKPVVAALNGHTVAGGAILAMAADFRILAEGPYKVSFPEVNLGLDLPPGMMRMLLSAVGPSAARDLLLTGNAIEAAEARKIGFAHKLAPLGEVFGVAREWARELAAKPAGAYASLKAQLLAAQGLEPGLSDRRHLDRFLEVWFGDEARAAREALARSLRRA